MLDKQVVTIGAGPAGLTAAYELTKLGLHPYVLEQRDKVGGLSCTECYKGFYFDMGGHRFFTKADAARDIWHEVLGEDLLRRPRLSRIYYNRRFFDYPLRPFNALFGLGIWQSILVVLSFIRWQLFPYRREDTFEEWTTNRFGRRLYLTFFKSYTEKLWGISCSELQAEWAAQRIKDLSLKTAVLNMFVKPKIAIKTLIEEFHYPRLGPGMLWEAVRREIEGRGGEIRLNSEVIKICRSGSRVESVVISDNDDGSEVIRGTHFISDMPLTDFIKRLDPAPKEVLEAAGKLRYRDFLTVCLIVNKPDLFPDNWIYIHSPEVKVCRIQNFKNWSPDMVPDSTRTSLGLEYFCAEGDGLWTLTDADLIELGKKEIDRIGLASYGDIEDGCVFRVPKAYPIYDAEYRDYLAVVREFVESLENFETIGRNGLHRYNNQDHSMITGMLAVRNLILGEKNDLWSVNTDQEYQEEIRDGTEGRQTAAGEAFEKALTRVITRLDPVAFGLASGLTAGLALLLATLALVIKGGVVIGPTLQLLNQYLPGYTVTVPGSLVGMVYAFALGFSCGWGFAFLRNMAVFTSAALVHHSFELSLLRSYLGYFDAESLIIEGNGKPKDDRQ